MTGHPAADTEACLLALLEASLMAWHVDGVVARDATGLLVIETIPDHHGRRGGHDDGGEQEVTPSASMKRAVRVRRAPAGTPFRWMVEIDGRERGAASIAGVLRVLRGALDPEYRPSRLRIAPLPVPAS